MLDGFLKKLKNLAISPNKKHTARRNELEKTETHRSDSLNKKCELTIRIACVSKFSLTRLPLTFLKMITSSDLRFLILSRLSRGKSIQATAVM